jgi:hypothetical protein
MIDKMVERVDNDLFINRANEDIYPVNRIKGQKIAGLFLREIMFFSVHNTQVLSLPEGRGIVQPQLANAVPIIKFVNNKWIIHTEPAKESSILLHFSDDKRSFSSFYRFIAV